MRFFSDIKALFQYANIQIFERLNTVEAAFSIQLRILPTMEKLHDFFSQFPKRDTIAITLKNDSGDIISFTNHQTEELDYSRIVDGLLPEDNIDIRIQIDKTVSNGMFSIYDFESFAADLLSRQLSEIMDWFSILLSGQEFLVFKVFDNDISFATRTLAFESDDEAIFKPTVNRNQRLGTCRDVAYFYNMNTYELIPDDFIVQGIMRGSNRLLALFGKLATILSIIYVTSSSSIESGKINVQISGQRTVNYTFALTEIVEDEKWQNIYTWVFTDGNPTDKALIAHNIICLHCKFELLLNLDNTVFEAIRTNYNLYLRNNVNQYLDMKRDIAEFIQNVVSQVGDYAIAILGKFKNNLLAIFGFLFTVVLTRIGSAQKWVDIFTRQTLYLIETFIGGSLIYLFICLFETRYKLQKTKEGYYELKENYRDTLSEGEIKEAFKNDDLIINTEKTAKKGLIGWSITWGTILVAVIIVIECFTSDHGLMVWLWNRVF